MAIKGREKKFKKTDWFRQIERVNNTDMDNSFSLTSDDVEKLEPILIKLSQLSPQKQTLDRLLNEWSQFVSEVESGYRFTIYDYTNDLCSRDFLQIILNNCHKNLYEKLIAWIESWDNRLILVTEQVDDSLLPTLREEEQGWWWFRIPIHPGNELKKDLETW